MSAIICGDALESLRSLDSGSANCCVTSPPYWGLRDYGVDGQIGMEKTPGEYVDRLVEVFQEVRRVLRDDGTLWIVIGDSYASSGGQRAYGSSDGKTGRANAPTRMHIAQTSIKPKDLIGIPWRVAFALQEDGWWLRKDNIWEKPNPMPESVRDRTTSSHEYVFHFSKSSRYYYDADTIKEPGTYAGPNSRLKSPHGQGFTRRTRDEEKERQNKKRGHSRPHTGFNDRWDKMSREEQGSGMRNKRSVWVVATRPFPEAHFAVYPPDLIRPCILAGCPPGGVVLDPFFGAGTTGLVAKQEGREYIGIELNPEYVEIAEARIQRECPMDRLVVAR